MPKKKSKKGKKGKKDKDTAKVERDPVAPDFIIPPPKPRENVSTTQARVQEFARGGAQNLKAFFFFFFAFQFFRGGPELRN